jgi:hypothetical protein
MIVFCAPLRHPVLARMSSRHDGVARARAEARRNAPALSDPAPELTEEELLAERMSFFESSYELNAGLEVRESSWSEALDICPDSGWPPLPPLPLPPKTRNPRR